MEDITSFSHRRLATILKNPDHPHHAAAKAEKDRRDMQREELSSFKNFDEATYKDTGWQKPKKDNMSAADGMNKAKELARKGQSLAKVAASGRTVPTIKPVKETKGAPKGYHFTRDGKLKKGDAGADGDGGAKLRSDPLDKQRSKIPPLPEKFANPAQQAAVMAKLKKSGKYDGKESFGRANLLSRLKSKGMDVDKMHSNNMKDADAAKKRSADAKKDLDSFRKKTGVTSEAKLDELSMNTLSSYKDKAKYSRDKAQNSAAANYMRGTKGSGGRNDPDIKTMQKRDRGSELYYSNLANKLRKQLADKKK